jgi:hypothetical protein
MYSLIHTDSLAQPRKLLCFKVFALYSQCKVFLHLNYIHKISLDKVQYNQQIIPAQKITANLVVLNLVLKMQIVRSRNLHNVDFNFSLEMIRLKLAKFRSNIPIGNWAQAIPAVLSENCPFRRIVPNKNLPTDRSH